MTRTANSKESGLLIPFFLLFAIIATGYVVMKIILNNTMIEKFH
jgi:uncharacterized protein (UPF0333 family)